MNNKRIELIRKFIYIEECLEYSKDICYENSLELGLLSKDKKHSIDVFTVVYSGDITINNESFNISWEEHKLIDEKPIVNPFLKKVSFLSEENKNKAIEKCASENYDIFNSWLSSVIQRNISRHK